jgi:signal transduction histidine kinase
VNDPSHQPWPQAQVRDLLATVWPVRSPADSELQRRKKVAVRSGHLAMALLAAAAVAGTLAADFNQLSVTRMAALVVLGLLYITWSLYGTHRAVRVLLWEGGAPPPVAHGTGTPGGSLFYFAVQLGLAALLYYLGDQGHAALVIWLVLLPPVAHSVILLPKLGIAIVSTVAMAILLSNVVRWHGWALVPTAFLEFFFAVLFTLVFTLLAVSSERARAEVQRLAGELGEANRKLREYAVQVEDLAATRERNRLAREIHDSLGHYLTVVNVQIEAGRALRQRDGVQAWEAVDKAQTLLQEGLREIRRSVAALRTSPLDNKPLAEALRQMVEESRAAGLAAEITVLGEARPLSPQAALTLYRAGQEGLTNVRKHARTCSARLVLDFQAAGRVRLKVSDSGAGAVPGAGAAGRFGLLGLRERAQLLGGEVRVQTAPGAGFTLEVEVPA